METLQFSLIDLIDDNTTPKEIQENFSTLS